MSPTSEETAAARSQGYVFALVAYGSWGVVPLFWKLMAKMGALEILAHRVLWSLVFLAITLFVQRRVGAVWQALRQPKTMRLLVVSSALIALNWGVFIWAVMVGRLVDASLGYFINPLANVALGVLLLKERLRRLQWIGVGLGALGLAVMFFSRGNGLVVPLSLATTFALYGLCRKIAPVDSFVGLFIETLVCAPFAIGYIAIHESRGLGVFGNVQVGLMVLAMLAGPITAVPLASFAAAARRLPLSTLGFFQYLAPTLQFLTAVLVFGEHVDHGRLG
ncbi:MAG: EamA family transporter RarD, partial [Polyangiaceae bacterium]|nr:EamA family transporter RarD [Polyangiaceae bacterium]